MARNYLLGSRGLSDETIRHFRIGFCSYEQALPGSTEGELKTNRGLLGKITVPICSEFGDVVAIGARSPSPARKGWFNTVFDKSNHLFMMESARRYIFEQNKAYVSEGYLDGYIPWQFGLRNMCCVMGTSVGVRKISLLARYCERVCLCFDTDSNQSGQKAQRKSLGEMAALGIEAISRIDLPMGSDPDTFVRENGLEGFLDLERRVPKGEVMSAKREYLKAKESRGAGRSRK
jgi:DNA primase